MERIEAEIEWMGKEKAIPQHGKEVSGIIIVEKGEEKAFNAAK